MTEGNNFKQILLDLGLGEKTRFVGLITRDNDKFYLNSDDRRLKSPIRILDTKGLEENLKAQVEITAWQDLYSEPQGKLIKILGVAGEHETEMSAIMVAGDIIFDFPAEVEKEAEIAKANFSDSLIEETKTRRDFRDVLTFTIDPETAKDFDDAISIRTLEKDWYEVGVHIADVSYFVTPGSALDREAAQRATSIYMVDRTIPMLPEILSNELCSLVPNQERLTFSAVFEINKKGDIRNEWYGRTIIKSAKRFTYEQVQEILDNKKGQYAEELDTLNMIAYALRKLKIEAGAISLDDHEVYFVLDENMKPIEAKVKVRTDSHKLVEDFMLLANKKVAEYASAQNKKAGSFVYRIHDVPEQEKLSALAGFLKPLGYELKTDRTNSSKALNKLLDSTVGLPEENMIQRATIRSMAKAIYSTHNIGHFGLAFSHYTHFTSPIRRYPDLMVHRLLDIYLHGKVPATEILDYCAVQAEHSSTMEQRAAVAERESIKFKQAEYMLAHLGETRSGIISGVTDFGMFVEDLESGSDGLVRMRDMKDDFYVFDEKKILMKGKRHGKVYRLGDAVKIMPVKADPARRQIDYKLV